MQTSFYSPCSSGAAQLPSWLCYNKPMLFLLMWLLSLPKKILGWISILNYQKNIWNGAMLFFPPKTQLLPPLTTAGVTVVLRGAVLHPCKQQQRGASMGSHHSIPLGLPWGWSAGGSAPRVLYSDLHITAQLWRPWPTSLCTSPDQVVLMGIFKWCLNDSGNSKNNASSLHPGAEVFLLFQ